MSSGDTIARIKERLSIVDVVSTYVELHQAGKNLKGKSPFTNERTPSFYVSPERGMYYCFSSSQGGDIFTFVEKMEGVEFKDALKILAERAGVELVPEDPQKKSEREHLYDVLEEATKFFESYKFKNPAVLAYLTDRGVAAETIAKWRIGYAPGPPNHGWRELKEHLEAKGFTKDEIFKAGLIKGADQGKEPYDVFRDRIMFPIFDAGGKVVAFSGRILSKDSEAPKYVNSPETELFNKSEILYGYHLAKNGIRNLNFALAVEGQFDVVLAHQAGYGNTVAVSGTALTEHHVALLQRLSNRVVLSLDADKAGIAAVRRASELMLPRGVDLKVVHIVGGKDPADLIKEDADSFRKVVGGAKHVVEYFLDILEETKKDDRNFKLRVREEILPLLVKISNRIDQEHFEGVIAERLGTTKDAIHFEVERLIEQSEKKPVYQKAPQAEGVESQIANVQNNRAVRKDELKEYLVVLESVFGEEKRAILTHALKQMMGVEVSSVYAEIPAEIKSALSFKIESHMHNQSQKQFYGEVVDKLNEYVRFEATDKIIELQEQLKAAEAEGRHEATSSFLEAISVLQKQKHAEKYTIDIFAE
ncbi:MAG: primase, primase protein [Candidatus Parcubacteria bacterium]|jgi:DNA primase